MGIIDIVVNLFTADEIALGQTGIDAGFMAQVRMPEEIAKASPSSNICKRWTAPASTGHC